MRPHLFFAIALGAAEILAVVACSARSPTETAPTSNIPINALSIAPPTPTIDLYGIDGQGFILKARSITLTATPTPGAGTAVNVTACTWASDAGTFSEIKTDGTTLLTTNGTLGTFSVTAVCGDKTTETSLTVKQTYTDLVGMTYHRVVLKPGGDASRAPAAWLVYSNGLVSTQNQMSCHGATINTWDASKQVWSCPVMNQVLVGTSACVTIGDTQKGTGIVDQQAGREIYNGDGTLIPVGTISDTANKYEAACGTIRADGTIK